jgi:hypothetical protein
LIGFARAEGLLVMDFKVSKDIPDDFRTLEVMNSIFNGGEG